MQRFWKTIACLAFGIVGLETAYAEKPGVTATAQKVDRLIETELEKAGVQPAPLVNDDTFLRRASLDLAGTIPTPNQVTDFALDPDPLKRGKLVDRLLKSEGYADIWASYWRKSSSREPPRPGLGSCKTCLNPGCGIN